MLRRVRKLFRLPEITDLEDRVVTAHEALAYLNRLFGTGMGGWHARIPGCSLEAGH